MELTVRLDHYGIGGTQRKPRTQACPLCRKPAIHHPLWRHRATALGDITRRALTGLWWRAATHAADPSTTHTTAINTNDTTPTLLET